MNYEQMSKDHTERLKRIVIGGGGIWVGIQETEPPMLPLVMFNSEYSHSTLCLPDDEFLTINAVHEKILASDALFRKGRQMREFQIYNGNIPIGDPIKAEQISTEAGGIVGFYAASVDYNSRKLLAVVVLGTGYSVREIGD